jgi:hypothetical protein
MNGRQTQLPIMRSFDAYVITVYLEAPQNLRLYRAAYDD